MDLSERAGAISIVTESGNRADWPLAHASFLHFFTKLFLAAPWSGLPSALTALLSQDCAMAVPMGKNAIEAARAKAARAKAGRAKTGRAKTGRAKTGRTMCFIVTSLVCAHRPGHL